jgi:hypothetical protein
MPSTYAIYTGDGSTKNFAIPFTYLSEDFVKVSVDGVDTSFTFLSEFVAQLATAPANGASVRVYRETQADDLIVIIPSSGVIKGADINAQSRQALNVAEEGNEALLSALAEDLDGNLDAANRRIKNVTDPTSAQDAATKAYVDAQNAAQVVSINASTAAAANSASAAATAETNAETAETNAETAATNAGTSATNAASSATLAQRWATEAEDVVVSGGLFSAYHWAQKAMDALLVVDPVEDQITAATTDTTPADADEFGYVQGGLLRKFTWADLKEAVRAFVVGFANNFTARQTFTNNDAVGIGVATANLGQPYVVNTNAAGAARLGFGRTTHAAYFGLDTDNKWKIGGWSMGANAYEIVHMANHTTLLGTIVGRGLTISTSDPSGGSNGDIWLKV